jgi:stage IV sporulation protein FB
MIAVVLDSMRAFILITIALTLHEVCHTLVAIKLGIEVGSIEVQPFGFVARLNTKNIPCSDELAISLAGPVFSLISGFSVVAIMQLTATNSPLLWDFALISISLGAINLLPALPLDGGRILASLLERISSYRTALLITAWIGIIIATFAILLGIIILLFYSVNVTLLMMGLFLFFAAIKEIRLSKTSKISGMIRRANSLRSGHSLNIKQLVLHKGVYAVDALKMLNTNSYNVFIILNDNMQKIGEFSENELLKALASMGNDITVGDIIYIK